MYAPPGLAIIQIMLVVEGRSRSIFLADRVNARRITQRINVGRAHFGAERMSRRTPTAQRVVDHGIRSGGHKLFRQWLRLRQQ